MKKYNLTIAHNVSNERMQLDQHFHTDYEIIFIEEGVLHFKINGIPYVFDKNCIIFVNRFEKHEADFLKLPYVRYVLILDSDFLNQNIRNPVLSSILKNRPKGFTNGFKLSDTDAEYVKSLLNNCTTEYISKSFYWEHSIVSDITKLLVFLYRNYGDHFPIATNNSKVDLVQKIYDFIALNYLEDISLDSIASYLYLNKYYISHVFKELTGYSIKRFIILNRISRAKDLLYRTEKSISEIGFNSGFNSTSNFIRSFNKEEDMTPLQYRKKHKKK